MLPQILATFWKAKKQTLWFKLRLCHRKTFLLVNFFAITYFRFYFIFYVKIAPQSPPYPTSLFPTNPPLKKILPSPPPSLRFLKIWQEDQPHPPVEKGRTGAHYALGTYQIQFTWNWRSIYLPIYLFFPEHLTQQNWIHYQWYQKIYKVLHNLDCTALSPFLWHSIFQMTPEVDPDQTAWSP